MCVGHLLSRLSITAREAIAVREIVKKIEGDCKASQIFATLAQLSQSGHC